MKKLLLFVVLIAVVALAAGHSRHNAAASAAGTSAPACTSALQSEFDKLPRLPGKGDQLMPVPASCNGLSHAQVQGIADEISANDAQAQGFANASPAVASSGTAAPAASSPPATTDLQTACWDALQSEIAPAMSAGKAGKITFLAPAACNGLSHAQVQALAKDAMNADSEALKFGQALSQAMNQ